MKDGIMAALPWIITGLCIAVLAVQVSRRRNRKKDGEKKGGGENYGAEGMCLGMCLGTALGTSFGSDTGVGLSIGMMVGLLIGSCIKKADGEKENGETAGSDPEAKYRLKEGNENGKHH